MKKKTLFFVGLFLMFASVTMAQPAWSTAGNSLTANGIFGTNAGSNFGVILRTNGVDRGILTNTGNLGLGNNNPGNNRLRVDGNQLLIGNLSFTNGLQSVYFGNPATPNNAMMYMFASGTSNVPRMVLAHSTALNNWGLQFTDASDRFDFVGAGTSALSIALGTRRVGINNAAPAKTLDVGGDLRISSSVSGARFLEFVRTGADGDWRLERSSAGSYLYISSSANDFATFCDAARFGLCTDTYRFTVYGNALASGGVWTNSDRKIKREIQDVSNATEIVEKLKARTYFLKSNEYPQFNFSGSRQYGFIAQELEEILPELVLKSSEPVRRGEAEEREEFMAVNYVALIPILVKSMQEQQAQIRKQQQQIDVLTTLVEKLTKDRLITSK